MLHPTTFLRGAATTAAVLAAAVLLAAPQAIAGGLSLDGRSPDTKDAALGAQPIALVDGRSPDTLDAARAAQANLLTPVDGRSPDTIDAAVQAQSPVVTVIQAPGFQWGDFGIGVAAAFGLMCLVAVSIRLLTAHKSRKQPGSVATA